MSGRDPMLQGMLLMQAETRETTQLSSCDHCSFSANSGGLLHLPIRERTGLSGLQKFASQCLQIKT